MKTFVAAFVYMLLAASGAVADACYCMIFAHDSKPVPVPVRCHIWGVFVRLDDNGKFIQEVTLSWTTSKISLLDRPVPGHDMSLADTVSCAKGQTIRMWGPFEISNDFFAKAQTQRNKPGGYYKFFDGLWRHKAQNCIHHLSDIAGPHRTGVYWGWWAAESVCKHFSSQGLLHHTDKDILALLPELANCPIKKMTAK